MSLQQRLNLRQEFQLGANLGNVYRQFVLLLGGQNREHLQGHREAERIKNLVLREVEGVADFLKALIHKLGFSDDFLALLGDNETTGLALELCYLGEQAVLDF